MAQAEFHLYSICMGGQEEAPGQDIEIGKKTQNLYSEKLLS